MWGHIDSKVVWVEILWQTTESNSYYYKLMTSPAIATIAGTGMCKINIIYFLNEDLNIINITLKNFIITYCALKPGHFLLSW